MNKKALISTISVLLTILATAVGYWGSPLNSRLAGPIALHLNLLSVGILGGIIYGLLFWQKKIPQDKKSAVRAFMYLSIVPPILGFVIDISILIVFIAFLPITNKLR